MSSAPKSVHGITQTMLVLVVLHGIMHRKPESARGITQLMPVPVEGMSRRSRERSLRTEFDPKR
jgi:hypothetical protein